MCSTGPETKATGHARSNAVRDSAMVASSCFVLSSASASVSDVSHTAPNRRRKIPVIWKYDFANFSSKMPSNAYGSQYCKKCCQSAVCMVEPLRNTVLSWRPIPPWPCNLENRASTSSCCCWLSLTFLSA